MSKGLLTAAMVVVRVWTRLYTWRMHGELRTARCLEIESDLWESVHDLNNGGDLTVAFRVLSRWVLGIPDDVLWRSEHMTGRFWRSTAAAVVAGLLVALVWLVTATTLSVPLPALEPPRLGRPPRVLPAPPPPPPPPCQPYGSRTPPDCTRF